MCDYCRPLQIVAVLEMKICGLEVTVEVKALYGDEAAFPLSRSTEQENEKQQQ